MEESGFTLTEIVITIAIIGILSAVAIPTFLAWMPNMQLKSAARDLYSAMQRARSEAGRTNTDMAIVFDGANNRYSFCSNPGPDGDWSTMGDNTILTNVDLTQMTGNIAFGHGSVPAGNSATTPPGAFPANDIGYPVTLTTSLGNVATFTPRGTANAGFVYLENRNGTAYAVGTQVSGVIINRRWMGGGVWR